MTKKDIALRCAFTAISAVLLAVVVVLGGPDYLISYGATGNELRDSLGIERNYYNSNDTIIIEEENGTDTNNTSTNTIDDDISNKEQADTTDSSVDYSSVVAEADLRVNIDNAKNEIDSLKSLLKSRLDNNSTAYLITMTVNNIFDKQTELEGLEKQLNELEYNYGKDNMIEAVYEPDSNSNAEVNTSTLDESNLMANSFSTAMLETINSDTFDIGYIGDRAPFVVDNAVKLVTPWGFTKKANETEYGSKFLGIELYANQNDIIKSQWNGVVVDIGKDNSNNAQYIKIYHGNSIYTIYRHINVADEIDIGTNVNQNQCIGYAADTTASEPDKSNHMMYQLEIDNKYINPLLIYGSIGKSVYEKWLTTTAYDNLVESGEKYYNDIEIETSLENEDEPLDVLYPDFNK